VGEAHSNTSSSDFNGRSPAPADILRSLGVGGLRLFIENLISPSLLRATMGEAHSNTSSSDFNGRSPLQRTYSEALA
jgi:hypothetical protein